MENEERKDINSIMDKLLRKQQELAARQAAQEEAAEQEEKAEENETSEPAAPFDDIFGDQTEETGEAEETGSSEEIVAEVDSDEPEYAVRSEEENPAEMNDNLYNDILDDVLASDLANEDDETIARRVQELYSEYVNSPKDIPEEEENADKDISDTDSLISDYFSPSAEEEETSAVPETDEEKPVKDGDDDLLLAALGYTDGGNVAPAAPKKEIQPKKAKVESDLNSAFAYNGKEFKARSQRGEILGAFDRENRFMLLRIVGTAFFFVLLMIFDVFGNKFGGALNAANYPVVNIMISLQLLILCAAFSHLKLYDGLMGLVKARPVPASVTLITLIVTVLYDVIIAIATDGSGFTLYNAPAAFCLCIQVAADALKLNAEKRNFEKLSSFDSVCALEETEEEGVYKLNRASFASSFFSRTNRYNGVYGAANYVIVPVLAVGIVLMLVSLVAGKGVVSSMNVLVAFVQFAMPVFAIAALEMPFRLKTLARAKEPSVVFNENDVAENGKIKKIILDETDMFGKNSLGILGFKNMPGFELFDDVAAASAICDKVGGTISRAFSRVCSEAADMLPVSADSVKINKVTDGGIDAEYNGHRYMLGSVRFLAENGIACPGSNDKAYMSQRPGTVVFHISTDGVETSRFTIVYQADPEFLDFADELSRRGIQVELRCLDPNLSHEFVTSLLGKGGPEISVVREEKSEFDTEEENYSLESGIVAEGDETLGLIDTVEYCGRFAKISSFNRKLSAGLAVTLALIGILLGAIGTFIGMSSLVTILIYIICVIPSMVLTKLI